MMRSYSASTTSQRRYLEQSEAELESELRRRGEAQGYELVTEERGPGVWFVAFVSEDEHFGQVVHTSSERRAERRLVLTDLLFLGALDQLLGARTLF